MKAFFGINEEWNGISDQQSDERLNWTWEAKNLPNNITEQYRLQYSTVHTSHAVPLNIINIVQYITGTKSIRAVGDPCQHQTSVNIVVLLYLSFWVVRSWVCVSTQPTIMLGIHREWKVARNLLRALCVSAGPWHDTKRASVLGFVILNGSFLIILYAWI
jgi:hypothetical protein